MGIFAWSMALVYSTRSRGAAHWADFWDVKKDRASAAAPQREIHVEIARLADGVRAGSDVYPMSRTDAGSKRAFRQLDQIKSDTNLGGRRVLSRVFSCRQANLVMSSAYSSAFDPAQPRQPACQDAWDEGLYDVDSWGPLRKAARLPRPTG